MADVIVIGAGIIGCAVAESLAARGHRVTVVDPRGVAAGATRASAGMLTPYSEGRHDQVLEALGARSLELYDAFVQRASPHAARPLVYSRTGSCEVALTAGEADELQARAADHAARGIASTYVPAAGAIELERALTDRCVGLLLVPAHGFVDAAGLTHALSAAAAAAGATLLESAVARVSASTRDVRVELSDREALSGDVAVLAAGSWAGQIPTDDEPLPVRPVRGQLLQVEWPTTLPLLQRIIWGSRAYIVPWADGTVLVGATLEEAGFDEHATVTGVRTLLDAACELVPGIADAAYTEVRVGLRPGTPDGLPIIGRAATSDRLIYATGHYRNGVLLAPLTAELVTGLVDGDADPALDVLRPLRFERS